MSAEVHSQDYQRMAHLLRRAGFGADRETVLACLKEGFDATIHKLVHYDEVLGPDTFKAMEDRQLNDILVQNNIADLQIWWLNRMVQTDRPLQEKMTLFWHGHFATAYSKVNSARLMFQQNQLFRRNAVGNFHDLTLAVSKDPAMIWYLDNNTNRKGHPNENYARELMELFTLGIGHYTEQDVRESARAFTGWTFNRLTGEYVFLPRQHDDGIKTCLGQTGNFNGDDIVNIIMQQPSCAPFICTKLFKFFIHENPTLEEVRPFAEIFRKSNYEIKPVLEAMFRSPVFYSEKAMWSKVKSPTDFVVSAVRATGAQVPVRFLPAAMRAMNQELFNPPSVKGWDGGLTWINTTTLMARFNFAMQLARLNEENQPLLASLEQQIAENRLRDAEAIVDYLAERVLHRPVMEKTRDILVNYMNTDRTGTYQPFTIADTGRIPPAKLMKVHGLLHLILLTPEYQLV